MSSLQSSVATHTKLGIYMPQLDALRAIAVSAVVIHHSTNDGWGFGAVMGVRLFFVLSGFLITGILLRSREAAEATEQNRFGQMFRFYVRRALRIFPLYYLVIAVGLGLNIESAREYVGWLLTYTLNLKMAHDGWFAANFAHFWTLCVEEQFYLAWPWVVLFLPRQWLLGATLAMISVGPGYRLYHVIGWTYFNSEATGLRTYIHTLTCLDSLGMGALLAVLSHRTSSPGNLCRRIGWTALTLGLGAYFGFDLFERATGWGEAGLVLGDLSLALINCWVVYTAALGVRGKIGRCLEWSPLTYIGKISYGIYVYHPFMPAILLWAFARLGWQYPEARALGFGVESAATLLVATLSWFLFEGPITALKRHIKY